MAVYLVERAVPGISMEQLARVQRAAVVASRRFTADGTPVRYLRTTFLPSEDRCLCLFEAGDPASVREVNQAAGLPFTRIVEAVDLVPAAC